ncbi:HAD-IA family hydrolase [Aurantimonas coralicida]|uniref:HAD-IA family hydrolase n=1 Tax=Aurantimonas coralicida TaxID=182270 RepID=UPI001D1964A5|nr:HAD-IA family hydrolase [Aurantimonas coralicida]MCC4299291.1 HAD-IA family hydrolase [Aurantimonas coralicida]
MKAVLFDCDGTIADSCGIICATMRLAFEAHGLPAPEDTATRGIIGLSLDEAIRRLHPVAEPALVATLVDGYRQAFRIQRADPDFREHLFPGMKALVQDLAARDDVFVGLVTGKSRRGVASICEAHGLTDAFLAVRTADDCPSKPHPAMVEECCTVFGVAPRDALVVGDSIFDMEMARAAGAAALGVAWGTHEPAPLLASGAYAVAETVTGLVESVDRWLADPVIQPAVRQAAPAL